MRRLGDREESEMSKGDRPGGMCKCVYLCVRGGGERQGGKGRERR